MENLYGVMKGLMSEEFLELGQQGLEMVYEEDPDYRGLMEDVERFSLMTMRLSLKPEIVELQKKIYEFWPTAALQATLAMIPMAELTASATEAISGKEAAELTRKGCANQRQMIVEILQARGEEIPPEVDLDTIEPVDPFAGAFSELTQLDDDGYPETDCTIDYE